MRLKACSLILLMASFFLVSCNSNEENANSTTKPSIEDNTNAENEGHEHSFSSKWYSDNEYHWHECSCGEKKDKAAHDWDSGVVTKEATETEDGEKVYTCIVCGGKKTVVINKDGTIKNEGEYDDGDEWGKPHQ